MSRVLAWAKPKRLRFGVAWRGHSLQACAMPLTRPPSLRFGGRPLPAQRGEVKEREGIGGLSWTHPTPAAKSIAETSIQTGA